MAEYEIKRTNIRLTGLEERRAEVAANGRKWEQGQIPVLDEQIAEANARLRGLISGVMPRTEQEAAARA
ncbi:hypothetical protein [Kocuria sp.]|uniref:hypothetical protein n=1 Tax=Kocuria sp. TaxID=1871328 RepID=UPI0026DEE70F|nr:hypothetical protein [Kocuria sp.]MDO5619284.1 hypothetical protein [Kocuria sp.]